MRDYGFTQVSSPIIFTIEGELIGAGDEFVEHVRERYNKVLGMTKEQQKGRLEENKRNILEEYRKKNEGLTLQEKVVEHQEYIKKKKIVEVMNDVFFEKGDYAGQPIYSRMTNLHRPGPRTLNIEDQIDRQATEVVLQAQAKAREDLSYADFVAMYQDHLEGRGDANAREPLPVSDSDEDVLSRNSHSRASKKPTTPKAPEKRDAKTPMSVKSKATGKEDGKEEKKEGEGLASDTASISAMNKTGQSAFNAVNQAQLQAKFNIAETCYLPLKKKLKIDKLDNKYVLLSHPFPLIEGELILL